MKRHLETPDEKDETFKVCKPCDPKEACPSYGSQNYWDERYKNNYSNDDSTSTQKEQKEDEGKDIEEGSPGFSWYFSYNELKPLLLPLVFGRGEEEEDAWSDCDDMEEILEGDDDEEEEEVDDSGEDNDGDDDAKEDAEEEEAQAIENDKLEIEEKSNDNEEEIDNEENPDEQMDAFKIDPNRPPRKILEIGCGDAPLGDELCKNILHIQEMTKTDAKLAVDQIICFDYSQCVIDLLLKRQIEEKDTTSRTNQEQSSKDDLKVDYKVHDARDLPYKDGEFHVIVDKGTLDAMLSDKAQGKKNCIKIVSEAARTLAIDGYIVIVSHLNANGPKGLLWVDEVLVNGLKDGDGVSNWRIEVHGNDVDDNDDEESPDGKVNVKEMEENEDEDDEALSKDYGPAVYIIRKMEVSEEEREKRSEDDSSRVDMKFFGY